MERMTEQIGALFPGFEGFECFFYEGVFSVYRDKGASGINVPDIDFCWKDGVVLPEFRRYILDRPDALFEKCIISENNEASRSTSSISSPPLTMRISRDISIFYSFQSHLRPSALL